MPKLPKLTAAILVLAAPAFITTVSLSETPTTKPVAPLALATTQPAIEIETHFSPEEEIAPTIVKLIDGTQHSLDIAAFAFTHHDIANAIIRAHRRGVKVNMVMDLVMEKDKYSLAPQIIQAGIPLRIRHKQGSQHSKYLILDQSIVITGSFNFTKSADQRNSENVVIIREAPKVVTAFSADYATLLAASSQP